MTTLERVTALELPTSGLPAFSDELAEHIERSSDLLCIVTVQLRWSLFALNGIFRAFLDEHFGGYTDNAVYINEYRELEVASTDKVEYPSDLERRAGCRILGTTYSGYDAPHYNFGNLLRVLKDDPTIPRLSPPSRSSTT